MSSTENLLREYRTEVPVRVDALIRNLGIELEPSAELEDGISGHIQRERDGRYVIRTHWREHDYRRRFTMAHELGHFVLHRSILDKVGGTNDSTMYRTEKAAPAYNSYIHGVHERQANSFAANLLMPDEQVRRIWREEAGAQNHPSGTPSLRSMYRAFEVSPSAMRWKLRNLDLGFYE